MPFKDINYQDLNKANEIHKLFQTQASKIKNIQQGNLEQAEFISGEKILPKLNPIQEILDEQKRQKFIEPLLESFKGVPIKAIEQTPEFEPHLKIMKKLSEEHLKLMEKQGIHLGNKQISFDEAGKTFDLMQKKDLKEVGKILGKMNQSLNGRNRRRKIREEERKENEKMMEINHFLNEEIKSRLNLKNRDVLKQVEYVPITGKGFKNCASDGDILERINVLVGEKMAGNTSKPLKNELFQLLHKLYSQNKIPKKLYETLINHSI